MKKIVYYSLMAALAVTPLFSQAQSLESAYFVEDYQYRHHLNPAFDNNGGYFSFPLLGNYNLEINGDFGLGDLIFDNPQYGNGSDKRYTTFMNPYLDPSVALSGFKKGANHLLTDMSFPVLSFGFRTGESYHTFDVSSKTQFGMSAPYDLFELAINTSNRNYVIDNMGAQVQSRIDIAYGYSRKINDQFRIGAKVKAIIGLARADIKMENLQFDLSSTEQWIMRGRAVADLAVKGLSLVSNSKENASQTNYYNYVCGVEMDMPGIGGIGYGLDLGMVYDVTENFTVSAALTDLGSIIWKNNVQAATPDEEYIFDGFHNVDIIGDSGNTFTNQTASFMDQLKDFAHLEDQGNQGTRTTPLGCNLNLGIEYKLPVYNQLSFGLLSTSHFDGAYSWNVERISANWFPNKWLDGGVNLSFGSFGINMGYIINLHPQGFNIFIGTDHLLGTYTKEGIPLGRGVSVNCGFNVTFGKSKKAKNA